MQPLFALTLAASSLASGGSDSHAPESSATTILLFVGLIGGAYLLAHFVVEVLRQRYLFVSGLEYMLLGAVLGPAVWASFHPLSDLTALAPAIAFAAGWVGLLYGMELNLRTLLTTPDRSVWLAVVESVGTALGVMWVAKLFFASGYAGVPVTDWEAWCAAAVLGCAAAAGSSSAVDLLQARYDGLDTQLLPLLRRSARLADIVAIIGLGVVFCIFHEGETRTAAPVDWTAWILITGGLGVFVGVMFVLFLGDDRSENSRFLALVGIIVFASGAAFFLSISALVVNLILGLILVNTRAGHGAYETVVGTSKPVSLILLVFAGALWQPVPLFPALLAVSGFVLLRIALKWFWSLIASLGNPIRSDIVRGLIAQGDAAVAIAISFTLLFEGPAVDLAYTAILGSVLLTEFVAPRLLRDLLVDAGELREDLGMSTAAR